MQPAPKWGKIALFDRQAFVASEQVSCTAHPARFPSFAARYGGVELPSLLKWAGVEATAGSRRRRAGKAGDNSRFPGLSFVTNGVPALQGYFPGSAGFVSQGRITQVIQIILATPGD